MSDYFIIFVDMFLTLIIPEIIDYVCGFQESKV